MAGKWETRLWKTAEAEAARRGYAIDQGCKKRLVGMMRKNASSLRTERNIRRAEKNLKRVVEAMAVGDGVASAANEYAGGVLPTAEFGGGLRPDAAFGYADARAVRAGVVGKKRAVGSGILRETHLREALKSLCPVFPIC